jgi:hypothetical protein
MQVSKHLFNFNQGLGKHIIPNLERGISLVYLCSNKGLAAVCG